MKPLPSVTFVIITYDRERELKITLSNLWENLYYSGEVKYLIADDSTPGKYRDDILGWFKRRIPCEMEFISTPKNVGWGANANHALTHVRDDIVLFLEDDYVLKSPIDITPYAALLMAHEGIGLVRLDGIAGHKIVAHVNETNIADYAPDYRQGMGTPGKLNYFLADHTSRETWLYSNRPHLKHNRFHGFYGQYPEGLKLGATEESFAHNVKDQMTLPGAPAIAVPLDATGWWDHIGISYQHSELDRGA
jgi:hypothetical protein